MNKHVMALAVCLALQPVIARGAQTIQPGVNARDSKQSVEPQRDRGVPKQVAKSCIPMQGQKPDNPRNDCDPMIEPRATPDATRLVHTFPNGTKLYADPHKNGIQKYSAIDQRGRALKVKVVQNPPKGTLIGPNDAIERGKQRAAEERERRREAFESLEIIGKGCVVVILDPEGSFHSYRDCPKGI